MREIKFRAWHILNMRMLDWKLLQTERRDLYECLKGGGFVPMQFTGLKDKNGVEIYEGDIVKARHEDGRYDTGSVVYGGKGAFCLYLPNTATGIRNPLLNYIFGIGLVPESDLEVIGNIYENKELLK